jgi:tetratricopeptide (TPR) repeat protein
VSYALLLVLLFIAVPAGAGGYEDLIAIGDQKFDQRENTAAAQEALALYRKASELDPNRSEAFWKMTRALYWLGHTVPRDQQAPLFKEGIAYGEQAVKLCPDQIEPHYWLGVTMGLYANVVFGPASLRLIDPIKKEMNFVIQKNPGFDSGGAYVVLGRLYFKLPGAFGGNNEKALEHLQTAVKYGPNRQLTHIYLAELHLAEDRKDQAVTELNQAITCPCEPLLGPECREWKARAKKLLAKAQTAS